MIGFKRKKEDVKHAANTAVEYMLLLGIVVVVVLLGFGVFFPRINRATNVYFNEIANGLMGKPPNSFFLDNNRF